MRRKSSGNRESGREGGESGREGREAGTMTAIEMGGAAGAEGGIAVADSNRLL